MSNYPTNTNPGGAMPLVKVKHKYQVTLPPEAREELGLEVGDLLEAQVEHGKITLTPKTVVDREIARGLEDIKKGRVRGPFKTADAAIRALKKPPRS
jgi:AbrB family looped-hinge helix DNA binding protein